MSTAESSNERATKGLRAALWVAVAVAIVVRVAFLAEKPFWRDEAWVANAANGVSLAMSQARAAPLAFLWLVHWTSSLPWLPDHLSYRLVPLLAGIAVVPALARLATVAGGSPRAGVIAAWLAAGLAPFVYYSRELKSYSLDLLFAILLPLLAIRAFADTTTRSSARVMLALLLAAIPWLTFGAIFPAVGLLAWAWLLRFWRAPTPERVGILACSVVFTASFGAAYFTVLAPQSELPSLHSYWKTQLLSHGDAGLLAQAWLGTFRYFEVSTRYFFWDLRTPAVALGLVGMVFWPPRHRVTLLLLAFATASACVAAALLDRYLLVQGRLLLFAAPLFLLWIAGGLDFLASRLAGRYAAFLAVPLAAALSMSWSVESIQKRQGPFTTNWSDFFRFDVKQDVGSAIDHAAQMPARNGPVLVTRKAAHQFMFYARGRLAHATYCERYCADFQKRASDWLKTVPYRGIVIMTDEDLQLMTGILRRERFTWRERARFDGARVWSVRRMEP